MIHYHGTPITPRDELMRMSGRCFCVSFAKTQDMPICMAIGQSVMLDNGAYSAYTRKLPFDEEGYYVWIDQAPLTHPHWAVVPDVIGGNVEAQRELLKRWPFGRNVSAPVYHIGLPTEYLFDLLDAGWWRVCFGSSAQFWKVGSPEWCGRMDQIFNALARKHADVWIHGLRMLDQTGGGWPFASADSSNVARNFKRDTGSAEAKAQVIDAQQPVPRWYLREEQQTLKFQV